MAVPRYQEGPAENVPPVARTLQEWTELLNRMRERPYRAAQVFQWIHKRGVTCADDMTNLPAALRSQLQADGLRPVVHLHQAHRAADGTTKAVLRLADEALIETVLIPMHYGDEQDSRRTDFDADAAAADHDEIDDQERALVRVTQCISTQVGCAMRCSFCATGMAGLKRHLGPDEIVAQVLLARSMVEPGQALTNVVFMGMGEPLHNYDATARALRMLTNPNGIGLSRRRVTVSTVGLVPQIERLGRDFDGKIGLAVSLHAPDDATRSRIVPVNKRYGVRDIIEALARYPLPSRRRITIEYALIEGVNSSPAHAQALAQLLRGLRVKVNLIPLNRVAQSPFQPPPWSQVLAFQAEMAKAGYTCLIRKRRGDDISAACGQLAGQSRA